MPRRLTARQSREVDRLAIEQLAIPGLVLMENAVRGAFAALEPHWTRWAEAGPIAVVCGTGNNGGDGFALARHLAVAGLPTRVFALGDPGRRSHDCRVNADICGRLAEAGLLTLVECPEGLPADAFADPAPGAVVDALLGTGLASEVRPPLDAAIAAINDSPASVVSLDVPSGLDADTGRPLGAAVRADHTLTFVAEKTGFATAGDLVGEVAVVSIGVPEFVIESAAAAGDAHDP